MAILLFGLPFVSGNDDHEPGEDEYEGDGCGDFWYTSEMNADQVFAFWSALEWCGNNAKIMWDAFEIFLPNVGHFWKNEAFVIDGIPQLGDTHNSKIYAKLGAILKIGLAYSGKVRDDFYNRLGDRIPRLTVFDLDLQNEENHRRLVQWALDFCRAFCQITPSMLTGMTIQDALNLEAAWMPFATMIFFYVLAYNRNECRKLGGGIAIKGYLRRLLLFIVESGVQHMLVTRFAITLSGSAHEWLRGR